MPARRRSIVKLVKPWHIAVALAVAASACGDQTDPPGDDGPTRGAGASGAGAGGAGAAGGAGGFAGIGGMGGTGGAAGTGGGGGHECLPAGESCPSPNRCAASCCSGIFGCGSGSNCTCGG